MKSTLSALKKSALLLAVLATVTLGLVSCAHEEDDAPYSDYTTLTAQSTLIGSWEGYSGEVYTITEKTFAAQNGYEGNELKVMYTNSAKTNGYIYIKYTKASETTTEDPHDESWTKDTYGYDWYRYSTTAPDVGYWYAIAFKDLTANSVKLSGAYGSVSSTDTLAEAIDTFTKENGYFEYFSNCSKK